MCGIAGFLISSGGGAFDFQDVARDMARRVVHRGPDDRVTLVRHNQGVKNAYADFWLMSQCQHFIIANSTFSWWAGWLAENPAKIVMTPGFEKRAGINVWGFKGLLPASWIKL